MVSRVPESVMPLLLLRLNEDVNANLPPDNMILSVVAEAVLAPILLSDDMDKTPPHTVVEPEYPLVPDKMVAPVPDLTKDIFLVAPSLIAKLKAAGDFEPLMVKTASLMVLLLMTYPPPTPFVNDAIF